MICHDALYERVATRTSSIFAGSVPALREMPRALTMLGMAEDVRIDVAKLRKAIVEVTGKGKRFTRRSLSMAASDNKNPDVVRDIFRVDKRTPLFDTVAGLARAMDRDIGDFLVGSTGGVATSVIGVAVRGSVAAGVWREDPEWPPDEWFIVDFDQDGVEGDRIGLYVDGRSMDRRFPPGTVLDCVKLIGSEETVEDGDFVIVERVREGLCERTCKRVAIAGDGSYDLIGESSLPEFEKPIHIGKPDEDFMGDNETRVLARVLHSRQSFTRRKNRR